jgi:DNA-binding ferritin-like protein (Dps family)
MITLADLDMIDHLGLDLNTFKSIKNQDQMEDFADKIKTSTLKDEIKNDLCKDTQIG